MEGRQRGIIFSQVNYSLHLGLSKVAILIGMLVCLYIPCCNNVVAFSTFSIISLLLQASLPCLLFASIPSTVVMAGDTYFNTSYPLVYMTEVSTCYMLILYLD